MTSCWQRFFIKMSAAVTVALPALTTLGDVAYDRLCRITRGGHATVDDAT